MADPGAPPITGEWLVSKDQKDYFKVDPKRDDIHAYSRTSKAGEHLKGSAEKLIEFKSSMAVIGTMMNEGIQSEVTTLINEYQGDPYYKGDDDGWKSGKKRLLDQVELAHKIGGDASASALGTEFHKLAEQVNKGEKPTLVRQALRHRLGEYMRRTSTIKFLRQEILIVNDIIKRAGSIDYLMQLPAGLTTPDGITHNDPLICAGDLKTGKWDPVYPAGVFAQLYGYAGGMRYDQETNERLSLHEDFNSRWAVLVHFPLAVPDSTVSYYWVDMKVGKRAAELNMALDNMIKFFGSKAGKPVPFDLEAE